MIKGMDKDMVLVHCEYCSARDFPAHPPVPYCHAGPGDREHMRYYDRGWICLRCGMVQEIEYDNRRCSEGDYIY